jgi:hypothetical protein
MRLASCRCRRRYAALVLAALFAGFLAACKTQPSPWSPEVDKLYHEMYGPIMMAADTQRRRLYLALLPLVFALLLAACAQSGGSRSWPRGYDPYHYRQPFQAGA